jgi:TRAP-type C4-dicarboxylate transport system permease small subunit
MARLQGVSAALDRAVIAICIACFLIMLGISFVGFFYQVITGAALSWTYSLARLFVPWIAMLSITVAFRRGEHVAMAILLEVLPPRVATIISYANLAIIGFLALLLVWFGWQFFITTTHYNMVSDQIQIHNRFVAACIPVTGLILLVHLACGLQLLDLAAPEAEVEELLRESEAGATEARGAEARGAEAKP